MNPLLRCTLAALLALAAAAAHAAAPLPRLNIDRSQVTVSGISAGAFMANQLGYAYSSVFKGVGMFAGGPYRCAGHFAFRECMQEASISPSRLATMQADIDAWSGTRIDAKANVAAQKVFLFVGEADRIVGRGPVEAVRQQYLDNGASPELVVRPQVGHEFPTDFTATGTTACGSSTGTFIANCSFDGARAVLTKMYGPLNPRNDAPAVANFREFDQRAFTGNRGMAGSGWLYVPADCAQGAQCRLHVALHGCLQAGDRFVRNTGYARWADSNNIVLLFPQARADDLSLNPNGCFDWVGWYGPFFAEQRGAQLAAIKAMVDQVSGAPAIACLRASNYAHTLAGRAYPFWGFTYALGSDGGMGWWNAFVTTTLRQTGPSHYLIGGC